MAEALGFVHRRHDGSPPPENTSRQRGLVLSVGELDTELIVVGQFFVRSSADAYPALHIHFLLMSGAWDVRLWHWTRWTTGTLPRAAAARACQSARSSAIPNKRPSKSLWFLNSRTEFPSDEAGEPDEAEKLPSFNPTFRLCLQGTWPDSGPNASPGGERVSTRGYHGGHEYLLCQFAGSCANAPPSSSRNPADCHIVRQATDQPGIVELHGLQCLDPTSCNGSCSPTRQIRLIVA